MAMEHLCFPIVKQGAETMGCWAACMSWFGKAVRKFKYTRDEIATMYGKLAAAPPPGKTIGGMGDKGRTEMFADFKWCLWQAWAKRSNFDIAFVESYLNSSPVLLSYFDPALGGAHMNVLVARVPFTESRFFVMDPDYDTYQIRSLQYYREKSTLFHVASLKTAGM